MAGRGTGRCSCSWGTPDTVWPLGTLAERPVRIEDGRFRGPGAYDMKAGLVQGLFAVAALRAVTGAAPAVTPVFLINSDEEIGSRESSRWIRRVAARADRVFVLEPSLGTRGRLKTARKGIGRFTVRVLGKAAHAGLDPEAGASAILELAHVVQKLFALNDRERGVTVNVGTVDGGLQPNVIAPESRAVAEIRVLTQADAERVEGAIRALQPTTPGTTITVEGGMGRPPMERTPDNRRLWRRARAAAAGLDLDLEEAVAGGGSDGNTTSLVAPTLDGLGAVGDGAHAVNEHLVLERMVERAALLACLLVEPPLRTGDREAPCMSDRRFFSSLTRITDFRDAPFETETLPRELWGTGDYVVVRVDRQPRGFDRVELDTGRMAEVGQDAEIVGALGVRHATLEAVGSWQAVGPDGRLELLTSAGLLGRATSLSASVPPLLEGLYRGHAVRAGKKLSMADFALSPLQRAFAVPTVLIVGTSMSAGKTTSGKVIVRHLKRAGLRVAGTKLSGAGRYRDVLGLRDAGADVIWDFVDAGLPSTVLPPDEFRPRLRALLAHVAAAEPDVVVAEAGASPLEPYNGRVVLEELGHNVCCTVLCASDPYAVVGVMQGFGMRPDLVAGLATSTSAGVELVRQLADVTALNLLDPAAQPELVRILERALERPARGAPERAGGAS